MNLGALPGEFDQSPHVSPSLIFVRQGEWAVSGKPDAVISTTLGSCVSACLWDPDFGVGGLNHIVLPSNPVIDRSSAALSVNAMEVLINDLLKLGAAKHNLRAKVFGGAQMLHMASRIGERNAEFVRGFLKTENIPIEGGDTGGDKARELRFIPSTGQVKQRFSTRDLVETVAPKPKPAASDDIEFF